MPLKLPKVESYGLKKGEKIKTEVSKSELEKSLKMSNIGKKVKPINKKVKKADDIFNPKA